MLPNTKIIMGFCYVSSRKHESDIRCIVALAEAKSIHGLIKYFKDLVSILTKSLTS